MSESGKQGDVLGLAKPVGWKGPLLAARIVRIAQFVFTVIALGLTAKAKDYYTGESTADYGVAVSVMSLVYLIVIFFTSWFLGLYFMAGPVLICETLFLIFWLTAFVALAAEFGTGSCSALYWGKSACQAAQASIAMAAVCMVLYGLSLVLLVLYTVLPVVRTQGSDRLWGRALVMNASFDRGTGLLIYSAPARVADPEIGIAADRQITASSGEAPVEEEKVMESADPLEPEPALVGPGTATQ
ncbi:hypothetical protein HG536_0F00210 [Torulaspora globosa]|uniref:MARVEL domain-containing protein n=1 Tax=Torulaspora globosa TaxID=48254 RepID=A0A7G3ZJL1_9SACH|nr:uncharacterized protein HG536_0F00210 [Torulaspora globosa]QLL33697.1 hypothetical protein HG536_0F00210 [Torulaspora globosa]